MIALCALILVHQPTSSANVDLHVGFFLSCYGLELFMHGLNPVPSGLRIQSMTLKIRLPGIARKPHRLALALGVLLCLPGWHMALAQSVSHGRMVFESQCMKCHRLDINYEGPALRTVLGRTAGKAPDFFYSEALAAATHVWTVSKLKAWLTNPESVVPGQEMNFHLDSAKDREDVIAFLAAQRRLAAPANPHCQPGQPDSKGCSKPVKETTP